MRLYFALHRECPHNLLWHDLECVMYPGLQFWVGSGSKYCLPSVNLNSEQFLSFGFSSISYQENLRNNSHYGVFLCKMWAEVEAILPKVFLASVSSSEWCMQHKPQSYLKLEELSRDCYYCVIFLLSLLNPVYNFLNLFSCLNLF